MNYLNTNGPYVLFQDAVNSEIFVDKSMLIDKVSGNIRTGNKYLCITRPGRFGKSMNAYMLGAYYTKGMDSGSLFEGLEIAGAERYEKHRNRHNVIFADMSRMPDVCRNTCGSGFTGIQCIGRTALYKG